MVSVISCFAEYLPSQPPTRAEADRASVAIIRLLIDIMCLIGVRQEQVQDAWKGFRLAIFTARLRPASSACSLAEGVRPLGRVCPIGPVVDSRPLQARRECPKPLRYPGFREEAVLLPIQPHPLETSL